MKQLLLIGLVIVTAHAAHAQGNICLDNIFNTDTNPRATRNGLFFLDNGNGTGPHLINQDFNVAFYGGTDSANLTLIRSFSGAAAAGDNAFGPGTFIDPSGNCAVIAGATNMAFFRIEAWTGNFASYNAALLGGALIGQSPVFSNPVTTVPISPADFSEMPAVCIGSLDGCVPEPGTFALAGLGIGALLVFRWRK